MSPLQAARRLLHRLGLHGREFNQDVLLRRLHARLGFHIAAVATDSLPAAGISGTRITTNGSHVVFYPSGATRRQRFAVICHECAHLWLDHRGRSPEGVLTGTDPPSSDDELAAESLGAALVYFADRPERLRSFMHGRARSGGPVPAVVRLFAGSLPRPFASSRP